MCVCVCACMRPCLKKSEHVLKKLKTYLEECHFLFSVYCSILCALSVRSHSLAQDIMRRKVLPIARYIIIRYLLKIIMPRLVI